jgi:hypothetical protein
LWGERGDSRAGEGDFADEEGFSERRGGRERSPGEFSVRYAYKWARSAILERAQALVFMSLNPAIRWICSDQVDLLRSGRERRS